MPDFTTVIPSNDNLDAKVYNNIDFNQFVKKCQDNQIPCEHFEGKLGSGHYVGPVVRANRLEMQRIADKLLATQPKIPLSWQAHGVGGFLIFPVAQSRP